MNNLVITRIINFSFILLIFFPSLIFSQISEVQITNEEHGQTNPVIWDSIVVYQDARNSTAIPFNLQDMIRSYNLNTLSDKEVYFLPYHQTFPDIWNNQVVWSERANIYMYNMIDNSIHNICENSGKQEFPKIEGNYIVWQDERNSTSDPDIYMYDITANNEIAVTNNFTKKQEKPDISGNYVIWVDENSDIIIYDITTHIISSIDPAGYIDEPAIYGGKIVWQSSINNFYQIFMYDINTQQETQITSGNFNHLKPAVSNVGIVWEDYRNSSDGYTNSDIYFFDFVTGNEMPICLEVHEQQSPNIFKNKIVWQDNRNGNWDIFMGTVEISAGADLEITIADDPDPVLIGHYESFTIKVINKGPENAENVKLRIKLPESYFEFISILSSKGDCSQFTVNDSCYLGSLAKGDSTIITLLTRAIGFLDVNTTASVNSETYDPNQVNNSVEENTTISEFPSRYIGNGLFPQIAVDSMNNPMISYTAVALDYYDIIYTYFNINFWERETVFQGEPYYQSQLMGYNSDFFIDKNNMPQMVYSFDRNSYDPFGLLSTQSKTLKYVKKESNQWGDYQEIYYCEPIVNGQLMNNKGVWSPNFVLDKNGYAHVTFLSCAGPASPGDIYYWSNKSGQWDSTIIGYGYDFLDMKIDKNDKLHLSYYSSSIGGIVYQTNAPDGIWKDPELVEMDWSGVQMEGMCTGIAVDNQSRPHIVYAGQTNNDNTEDIKYAYKDNSQWHIQTVQKGTNVSAHNSIATDNHGNVHLCYYSLKQNKLVHAVKLDSGWTSQVISNKGKEWNDIAVAGDGTAHICYTDGSEEKVYYASSSVAIDGDLDGITDISEQGEDGDDQGYDGNDDGIPDFQQKNVTSFHTSDGKYYVTLVAEDSLLLSDVSSRDIPSIFDIPPNFDFPFGAFHFTILGLSYGDSTSIDLILPEGMLIDKYYKYGSTESVTEDHWYEFMYDGETGAIINENVITIHLVDGLRGDDDLIENGVIHEPGLPGVIGTSVYKNKDQLPKQYALYQNYPNPFNPSTKIQYTIPNIVKGHALSVRLVIYDVLGRKVATLVDERQKPGNYEVQFDEQSIGHSLASGIYFYTLRSGSFVKSKKMILLK